MQQQQQQPHDESTTAAATPHPHPKTYNLTASSISYSKSTTTLSISPSSIFTPCVATSPTLTHILNRISFTAYPSQILAVVGPSGAGKSTLLDILAARTSPTSGSLLLNNSPLDRSSYRKLSAYVPQHDAFIPLLTVSETFAFAASLLLPLESTPEITHIVASLLEELRLTHAAQTRLADSLSGGERRRVSIGLCLLRDPGVLVLDEPTSGLDSSSAFNVIKSLECIAASRHRTVVLSIHQPSFKILSAIDRILLLSKGSVVHHGTLCSLQTFLQNHGYSVPPQLNPLEYAMEILNQLSSSCCSGGGGPKSEPVPLKTSGGSESGDHGEEEEVMYKNNNNNSNRRKRRSSRIHEIVTLCRRSWKIIYRTRQLLLTNTLEALVVGLVLGTIYINIGFDKQGMVKRLGLFAFTLTFLLSSTAETLPIFINERPILIREASSGVYSLSSYLIANTLLFLPYLLAIAAIYSVSVYFLVGLCATWQAFSYFLLVIWVILLMANSFVLFLSSVTPNYIAGTSLLTMLLGGFFLFSGYFISQESMPKYWLFMHFFSMYKHALDALLVNEYSCLGTKCLMWYREKETCMVTGGDVLKSRGLHEGQRWSSVSVLVGFFLFYRFLWLLVLLKRVSRSKK